MNVSRFALIMSCVAIVSASCRPSAPPAPPAPVPVVPVVVPPPPANPKLPPVPEVRGPLKIDVIYPKPDQLLTARDSNFIFGSVGSGDAALAINGVSVPVWPNGAFLAWLAVPKDSAPRYDLVAMNSSGRTESTLPIRLPPAAPPPARPDSTPVVDTANHAAPNPVPPDSASLVAGNVYVAVGAPASTVDDTDRVSIARPAPGNGQEYKWFLLPGTVVKATGTKKASGDDFVRIELDSAQEAWVLRSEIQAANISASTQQIVGDSVAPVRRVGAVRLEPGSEWMDVVIPIDGPPPPYLVEEADRSFSLLVYGVAPAPVISMMPQNPDGFFTSISSTPEPNRVRYTINLAHAPYGYLVLWQSGALVFRVRRPPRIADTANPLRGLTITVDPGHPPGGTTGPTGFYEADAALAVGLRLRDLLTARGANVVMTRSTPEPVELGLRPIIGRRANAHAFVSIHFDALPDGENPFLLNGSWTLYFWRHSLPLAQATQAQLLEQLGLRDKGAQFQNLAVARGPWMPAILTEGGFLMMPDQEAAFRTPEYQTAYATAILRGLETYFASLAQSQ